MIDSGLRKEIINIVGMIWRCPSDYLVCRTIVLVSGGRLQIGERRSAFPIHKYGATSPKQRWWGARSRAILLFLFCNELIAFFLWSWGWDWTWDQLTSLLDSIGPPHFIHPFHIHPFSYSSNGTKFLCQVSSIGLKKGCVGVLDN